MKKRLILKVCMNIIFIACVICLIFMIICACDKLNYYREYIATYPTVAQDNEIKHEISLFSTLLISSILSTIFIIITLVFLDFKDISYLCGSLFKEMKEHKEATKEERKQKKIEELEKQLNELKKDE